MAIQIRRGTNSGWESNNSNIVVGEPAVVTDEERAFIGTGSGSYMELANIKAIAPAFDSTKSYYAGDYVSYQGKLYVCLEDTTGAWNASKWLVSSIGQALSENMYANFESTTVSGDIVSVNNGAGDIPVRELIANIVAVQSGSGDPSPDNVRPITGWNEVNVNVTGVNMISPSMFTDGYIINDDGSVTSNSNYRYTPNYIGLHPNTTYTFYCNKINTGNYSARFALYDKNKGFIIRVGDVMSGTGAKTITFTTTADTVCMRMFCPKETTATNIQVSQGSTITEYIPYNGTTYTTDLDSTRYGGTLDVTTGVLTITWKSMDMGDMTWVYNSTSQYFSSTSASDKKYGNNNVQASCYKTVNVTAIAQMNNGEIKANAGAVTIYLKDFNYTDGDALKTARTGQTIIYELNTPQTVQLTPQQVRTLLGQNNIWADSGEVEVTYRISNVQ